MFNLQLFSYRVVDNPYTMDPLLYNANTKADIEGEIYNIHQSYTLPYSVPDDIYAIDNVVDYSINIKLSQINSEYQDLNYRVIRWKLNQSIPNPYWNLRINSSFVAATGSINILSNRIMRYIPVVTTSESYNPSINVYLIIGQSFLKYFAELNSATITDTKAVVYEPFTYFVGTLCRCGSEDSLYNLTIDKNNDSIFLYRFPGTGRFYEESMSLLCELPFIPQDVKENIENNSIFNNIDITIYNENFNDYSCDDYYDYREYYDEKLLIAFCRALTFENIASYGLTTQLRSPSTLNISLDYGYGIESISPEFINETGNYNPWDI